MGYELHAVVLDGFVNEYRGSFARKIIDIASELSTIGIHFPETGQDLIRARIEIIRDEALQLFHQRLGLRRIGSTILIFPNSPKINMRLWVMA